MRFTSLIIELIRARPRLVVWLVVLFQAALWLILALLLYRSPPGDLATVLAYGREYQVGTDLGPPLAFWLADIAFRAAGNHMFGVYLLAQLCGVATFWALYLLARAVVGGQQAVLAVLLTMTVVAFGSSGGEFGPLVLARPLWALLLLHSWQLIGQRRNAWFAWSIDAGLLLLTTSAAIGLLLLVAGFALATRRGRRTLMSFDPLFALLVIVVLALPYLIWLIRADALTLPPRPRSPIWAAGVALGRPARGLAAGDFRNRPAGGAQLRLVRRNPEEAPIIYRPPVDPLARDFVYFFAIGPALAGSLVSGLFDLDHVAGGAGVALLMSGLAVIVATGDLVHLRRQRLLRSVWAFAVVAPALAVLATTFFLPWTGGGEVTTSLPATAIATFLRRQLRAAHQPAAAGGGRRRAACDPDRIGRRASASVSRRDAGTDAMADNGEIQRDRRRRGLARLRHGRHAACRYRAAVSRPGARSAAGIRVAGERAAAFVADRLGDRAAEGAVNWTSFRRPGMTDVTILPAPAPWRSRANPARPSACRTASAADRPGGKWRARGSRGCRYRNRTSALGSS